MQEVEQLNSCTVENMDNLKIINDNESVEGKLSAAIRSGDLDQVKLLDKEYEGALSVSYFNGYTLLHIAAQFGMKHIVQFLLDMNANIDAVTQWKWTALHSAAHEGHVAIVDLLLSRAAKIDARTNLEFTPLHLAANSAKNDMVMEEKVSPVTTPEEFAVIVELLLIRGAEIDARTNYKFTALHLAANATNTEAVKKLLARGANCNALTDSSWTPLNLAAYRRGVEPVRELLLAGADVQWANRYGWTPLHQAAFQGILEMVRMLIARGADITATNRYDDSPLRLAAWKGHSDVVMFLASIHEDI